MKDIRNLESLLAAGIPLVAVESHEESKVLAMMERFANLNDRAMFVWRLTHGLRRAILGIRPTTPRRSFRPCATGATGSKVSANREALLILMQHLAGFTEEDARRLARMAIRDDGAVTLADIGP